jgi:RNase P/RNase MRP subunit p30
MNKVAIYVEGGVIQGIRSNLSELDIEIIDVDSLDSDKVESGEVRWDELQTELKFGY